MLSALSLLQIKTFKSFLNEFKCTAQQLESYVIKGIELPEDELDIKIIEEHEDKARSPFNEADSLVETLPL